MHDLIRPAERPFPEARPALPSLRELEVLRAVVTLRTTAAAARSLAVSQPAVSRSLASLEDRLGRALFVRQNGALVPTPDAVALSNEAHGILQAVGRIVASPGAPPGGQGLRLITTATLAQHYLAKLLPGLMRAHPELRLRVEIATSAAVVTAVADGTAQAGLLDQSAPHGSLTAEVLHRNQAHVVLPVGHALSQHDVIGVEMLRGLPLIALPRRFTLRAQVDQTFRSAGLQPVVAVECATAMFAAELVQSGMGLGILNPFPLRAAYPGLVFRPFRPAIGIATMVVVPSATATGPVVGQFIQALREYGGADGPAS